jgi:nitroreductase
MASTATARKLKPSTPTSNTANQAVQQPTSQQSLPPPQIGKLPLKTNIRSEYVAGGSFFYQPSQYLRSLPAHIDDLSQQFGADIYERMSDDSKVASAINWLKLSTLAQGVRVVPTEQDEEEEGYNESQEIADFCKENLERIEPPIKQVCWSLLDAVISGYKVAEQTYEYVTEPGGGVKTYLKSIKVKPRNVTAFVVDAFQNLKGILGLIPGGGMGSVIPQGLMAFGPGTTDSSKYTPSNLIGRKKFLVFTHRPKDMDPRGTSALRPAYAPWWLKQQGIYEYTKYLSRFASPSLFGTTPEGAQGQVYTDQLGNIIPDANGNPVMLTPEQAMQEALAAFQNGTVVAFQYGADVKPIKAEGNGEAFMDALTYADKQIDMSVTSQTLASGEAGHQTGAATDAHQDVSDMVIAYTKEALATAIKNDCLRVLVALNYGEEAAKRFTPDVSLSEMPQQDFAANAMALGTLWKSGYLDPSQQPKLDAQFNLPERSAQSIEEAGHEQGMGAGDGSGDVTQAPGQQAQQPPINTDKAKKTNPVKPGTSAKPPGNNKQPEQDGKQE